MDGECDRWDPCNGPGDDEVREKFMCLSRDQAGASFTAVP